MSEWNRATPWRQGHVLTDQTVGSLGLRDSQMPENTVIAVISHDCDLVAAPDKEPNVEVIIGQRVEKIDGNLAHAKNARALHLEFTVNGNACVVELLASKKAAVPKCALAGHVPDENVHLDPKAKSILQRWLAARYRRSAFPDQFEERLNESGFSEKLSKIMRRLGEHIRGVFFEVDDGREIHREGPDDAYSLNIILVYASEPAAQEAELAALNAQHEIETALKAAFCNEQQQWRNIELCECRVISDEALTYAQSLYYKEWRLEHLSLREEPQSPMMGD